MFAFRWTGGIRSQTAPDFCGPEFMNQIDRVSQADSVFIALRSGNCSLRLTAVILFQISELFEEKVIENYALSALDVCIAGNSYQCEHSPDFSRTASMPVGLNALAACLIVIAFRIRFPF